MCSNDHRTVSAYTIITTTYNVAINDQRKFNRILLAQEATYPFALHPRFSLHLELRFQRIGQQIFIVGRS